jgi:hypothetical protein
MLRRTAILAALAGVLATGAWAPPASADAFDDVFADYQKDARIDACKHSERDLKAAKGQVPNDIEQYAPDFPAALDEALEDRARSGCKGAERKPASTTAAPAPAPQAGGGGGATPAAPAGGADPAAAPAAPAVVPQPPGSAQAVAAASDGAIVTAAARSPEKGSDDAPVALVVLAALGGLLALGLLVWGLARFFAWDPAWLASARHAIAEAGWRTSGAWADFTDWLRRGRTAPE